MCRFLIINSKTPIDISEYLPDFAKMCQESERQQADGWGIAWPEQNGWQAEKFLSAIWESADKFSSFPKSKVFFVHARGSSFKKHQGAVEFNQPFTQGNNIFVFNGFLNSVKLPESLDGQVGSQRIFNLLLKYQELEPAAACVKTRMALEDYTGLIEGLNFAFSNGSDTTVVCRYLENPDYYAIRYYQDQDKEIISSYEFGNLPFKKLNNGEHLNLRRFTL